MPSSLRTASSMQKCVLYGLLTMRRISVSLSDLPSLDQVTSGAGSPSMSVLNSMVSPTLKVFESLELINKLFLQDSIHHIVNI